MAVGETLAPALTVTVTINRETCNHTVKTVKLSYSDSLNGNLSGNFRGNFVPLCDKFSQSAVEIESDSWKKC